MPRKNHVDERDPAQDRVRRQAQDADDEPPPTMPMAIAPIVPMIVPFQSPSMTGVCCMISRALGKFHRSLVRNELTIIDEDEDDRERHPAPRVGTGRAWMTPGRSPVSSVTGSAVTGSARSRDAPASTEYFFRAAS